MGNKLEITDAVVEAACNAHIPLFWKGLDDLVKAEGRKQMRAALTAILPLLQAQIGIGRVKELTERDILALVRQHFPRQNFPHVYDALTYEKTPEFFPQATYDVPTGNTIAFARAVEQRILSAITLTDDAKDKPSEVDALISALTLVEGAGYVVNKPGDAKDKQIAELEAENEWLRTADRVHLSAHQGAEKRLTERAEAAEAKLARINNAASRQTFTVSDGHEAVRDADGRATGETRPASTAEPARYSPFYNGIGDGFGTVVMLRQVAGAWVTFEDHEAALTAARLEGERVGEERMRDQRQKTVAEWCAAAFGAEHQSSVPQRGLRMLEEAIEAYQAINGDQGQAHKLIDYIFAKEPGKLFQELGGLGVTVLALAAAAGVSADDAERTEIARVLAKPLEWFHARNKAKNDAGFDATAYPTSAAAIRNLPGAV